MRPNLGVCAQDRRLKFPQVLDDGIGALRIVADAACLQRQIEAPNPLSDVGQPQHHQTFITLPYRQPRSGGAHHVHQIAMRQGPSQAVAARKLNHRGLIRLDRLNRGGPIGRCLGLDKVRQADAAGIDEIAQSLHVEHDDPRQRRTAIADRQDFVELLFILDESQPGSAGRQQMANAIRLLVRVDGNTGRAATQDRQVGVDRLRPRFRQDRHHVATREIRQQQCQPDLADLGV